MDISKSTIALWNVTFKVHTRLLTPWFTLRRSAYSAIGKSIPHLHKHLILWLQFSFLYFNNRILLKIQKKKTIHVFSSYFSQWPWYKHVTPPDDNNYICPHFCNRQKLRSLISSVHSLVIFISAKHIFRWLNSIIKIIQ